MISRKELDLLYFGGGIAGKFNTKREEEVFYSGYGKTEIDYCLIVLLQILRIVEDITIYYDYIINKKVSQKERITPFDYLKNKFLPDNTIDCMYRFLIRA